MSPFTPVWALVRERRVGPMNLEFCARKAAWCTFCPRQQGDLDAGLNRVLSGLGLGWGGVMGVGKEEEGAAQQLRVHQR